MNLESKIVIYTIFLVSMKTAHGQVSDLLANFMDPTSTYFDKRSDFVKPVVLDKPDMGAFYRILGQAVKSH